MKLSVAEKTPEEWVTWGLSVRDPDAMKLFLTIVVESAYQQGFRDARSNPDASPPWQR